MRDQMIARASLGSNEERPHSSLSEDEDNGRIHPAQGGMNATGNGRVDYPAPSENGYPAESERRSQGNPEQEGQGSKLTTRNPP